MTEAEREEIVRRVRKWIQDHVPHHGQTSQESWRPEPPKDKGVEMPPENVNDTNKTPRRQTECQYEQSFGAR